MWEKLIAIIVLVTASGFSPSYSQEIDLLEHTGTSGYVVDGAGYWITSSASGDFNGDGMDDLALGVALAQVGGNLVGAVQIIFGNASLQSPPTQLLPLPNQGSSTVINSGLPYSVSLKVATAGDVNNDGIDDLLIDDNPGYNNRSATYERTYLMYGSRSLFFNNIVDLNDLKKIARVTEIIGPEGYSGYRKKVNAAGDINDDGVDDIAISYPLEGRFTPWTGNDILLGNRGRVYVIFGKNRRLPNRMLLQNLTNREDGHILSDESYITSPYKAFGASMAPLGDMNGDGVDDLAISVDYSYEHFSDGRTSREVRILFGDSRLALPEGEMDNWLLTDYLVPRGMMVIDNIGGSITSIGGVGDVNGDGLADILIGSIAKGFVVFGFDTESLNPDCGRDRDYIRIRVVDAISATCGGGYEISPRGGDFTPDVYASSGQGDMDGDGLNEVLVSFYKRGRSMDTVGAIIFGQPDSGRYIPPYGSSRYLYINEMYPFTGRRLKLPYTKHYSPTIAGWVGDLNNDGEDGYVFGIPWRTTGQASVRY